MGIALEFIRWSFPASKWRTSWAEDIQAILMLWAVIKETRLDLRPCLLSTAALPANQRALRAYRSRHPEILLGSFLSNKSSFDAQ